jgi:dienelactone hydrolase
MSGGSRAVDLEGFSRGQFSYDGTTHAVYRRGTGPGVVVIHEVPGITPLVARFGRRAIRAPARRARADRV